MTSPPTRRAITTGRWDTAVEDLRRAMVITRLEEESGAGEAVARRQEVAAVEGRRRIMGRIVRP